MVKRYINNSLISLLAVISLAGCGGGGGGSAPSTVVAPSAPTLNAVTYDLKQLVFTWSAVSGATYYKLNENPDGASGYTQIGGNLTTTTYSHSISVHLQDWVNASYILEACNATGCTSSAAVQALDSASAIGYFKASNAENGDYFGWSVAVSGDGNTLAVGARLEDSASTSISATGPTPAGDSDAAADAGAVYVFAKVSGSWVQQAYIKASNAEAGDDFGRRVALSQDGNTLAVSARLEAGDGVSGQADNSAAGSGAVYVYTRSVATWTQQAYIKASNAESNDFFGYSLGLSADGDTLAVGAIGEDSNATGIGGVQGDNTALSSGAVYVFTRSLGVWTQQEYLKASNTEASDSFGYSLDLSDSGDVLAVGAIWEDSDGSAAADNTASNAGAVFVYTRSGATWSPTINYIKASNAEADDHYGGFLSLSGDGKTLAVGAATPDTGTLQGEQGVGTGVTTGGPTAVTDDDSADNAGAVYVYTESGGTWTQQAYVKASNTGSGDLFGFGVSLSQDGNTMAIGARDEDGNTTGVGNSETGIISNSGAVYVYSRSGGVWSNTVTYVKASNTGPSDSFGYSVDLSDDAAIMAVGAFGESSASTTIGGNQSDNAAGTSGAVYLY